MRDNRGSIHTGDVNNKFTLSPVILWLLLAAVAVFVVLAVLNSYLDLRPKPQAEQPDLLATPSLGMEFWQNDSLGQMSQKKWTDESIRFVDVTLSRQPFKIRFPTLKENQGLKINTSFNDSKFGTIEDEDIANRPPFCSGCSYAAYKHFNSHLTVGRMADYFADARVRNHSATQDEVYVSGIDSSDESIKLADSPNHLYLTCWLDDNLDGKFQVGEFEFVRLSFES
ncbi:hypothetical protein [Streptomyces chartreusis]|uniref:hypothetical protein n=1 Tax=Streptomyces chartreusis TaxID=1969 RepID=UPI0038066D13